jgi:hypothetical protein
MPSPEDWKSVPSGSICYGLNYTAADGSRSCAGNLAPMPTYTGGGGSGSGGGGAVKELAYNPDLIKKHSGTVLPTDMPSPSGTGAPADPMTDHMLGDKTSAYIAAAPSNAIEDYLVTTPGPEPLPGPRTPYGVDLTPPPILPASTPQIRDGRMSGTLLSMEIDASRASSARQAIEIAAIRGDNVVRGLFGF